MRNFKISIIAVSCLMLTGCEGGIFSSFMNKVQDVVGVITGDSTQGLTGSTGFEVFQLQVWPNLKDSATCGSCHHAAHAAPIGSQDVNQAYQASLARFIPSDFRTSLLYVRAGNLHCGTASCGPAVQTMLSPYLEAWALAELSSPGGGNNGGGNEEPPPAEPVSPLRGVRNYRDWLNYLSQKMPEVVLTGPVASGPDIANGAMAVAFNDLSVLMPSVGAMEEITANSMGAMLHFLGKMCGVWAQTNTSRYGYADATLIAPAEVNTRKELARRYIERFLGRAALENSEVNEMSATMTEFLNDGAAVVCGADTTCKARELRKIACILAGGTFEALTL